MEQGRLARVGRQELAVQRFGFADPSFLFQGLGALEFLRGIGCRVVLHERYFERMEHGVR